MLEKRQQSIDGTIQRALVPTLSASLPQFLWIQAPSGAGKTILARQLASRDTRTVLWLRFETAHGDLSYLVQSLAFSYSQLPDAMPFINTPRSLGELLHHIATCHPKTICFAFDNFEMLNPFDETRDSLARAVLDYTGKFGFMVTSQSAPQGIWQRFLSMPAFQLIGPDQLNFSEAEITHLIEDRLDLDSMGATALGKRILAQCHGWPTGVSLLVEQWRQKPSSIQSDQSDNTLYEHFAAQILNNLDGPLRSTLEIMAYLPSMPAALLKLLFSQEQFNQLVQFKVETSLIQKDIPWATADHQEYWRMNPMMQQSLVETIQQNREELGKTIADYIDCLTHHGHDHFALEVMLIHKDVGHIADYLGSNGNQLLLEGRLVMLGRLLDCLPPQLFEQAPPLRFFRGIISLQSNPWKAIEDFRAAYEFAKHANILDLHVHAWALLVDSIWFAWERGQLLDPLIEELQTLKLLVSEAQRPDLDSVLSRGAFTALSLRQPDHPDFEYWVERSLVDFQGRAPRHEIVRRGTQLLIHLIYGPADKERAALVLRRVQQFHDSKNETATDHCSYYVVKASFDCWFSKDDFAGGAIATTGLNVTAELAVPHWDALLINAALYRLAPSEDRASIDNFIELLEQRILPGSRSQDSGILHHFLAYRQWLDNDHVSAEKTLSLALSIVEESGFVLAPVFFRPGLAAILHEQGRSDKALSLLDETIQLATNQTTIMAVFIAKVVKASILFESAQDTAKIAAVREAYELGNRHSIMALPWVKKSTRRAMSLFAQQNNIAPNYAGEILASMEQDHSDDTRLQRLEIRTLGIPDIVRDGNSILTSRKPQKVPLLAISHLVASGETGIRSEKLIEALWPEADEDAGRQRLKTLTYRLRKLLGHKDALKIETGKIYLNREFMQVDAWLIAAASRSSDQDEKARAIQLYNGIFFDGFLSHPDLLLHRTYLESKIIEMVELLGNRHLQAGRWREALNIFEDGLHRIGPNTDLLDLAWRCMDHIQDPVRREKFLSKWQPIFMVAYDIDIRSRS